MNYTIQKLIYSFKKGENFMKKLILTFFLLLTVISFAEIVYITPTGKKYHATKTCKGLARAKKIIPIERAEAEAKGYKPCKYSYGG